MNKTLFIFIYFLLILISSAVYGQGNITAFDENWAMNLFINYNSCSFENSLDSMKYSGEKPWQLGLGIRYKNISAEILAPILLSGQRKNWCFDSKMDFYYDKIYYEANFTHFPNLILQTGNEQNKLDIYSSAIMATFIQNNENHSLSSIIKLDKKQEASSGSLLYGFGVFYSSLYSTAKTIDMYSNRQHYIYFGPSIGYSYTFVFRNNMFLNLNCVAFANPAINMNTGKLLFIPCVEPKIILGSHSAKWSINLNMMNNSAFIIRNEKSIDPLVLVNVMIIFSKRFSVYLYK